jgi:hypothetical protein
MMAREIVGSYAVVPVRELQTGDLIQTAFGSLQFVAYVDFTEDDLSRCLATVDMNCEYHESFQRPDRTFVVWLKHPDIERNAHCRERAVTWCCDADKDGE